MQKKINKLVAAIFALSLFAGVAQAQAPDFAGKPTLAPKGAIQISPNVFSLGVKVDALRGDLVEGYLIVHPKKQFAKPVAAAKGGVTCYGFLARDAKWKVMENWVVNTSNSYGISSSSVLSTLSAGIQKWENAAQANILGSGTITTAALVADTVAMDNLNEVYFGELEEGTIGVTIVWGIFGGPPQGRELREWDQVYNTLYNWGDAAINPALMDFESIATHELGHSVGMGDLYQSECIEETMYGYGTEGETKKRDLNTGDIAGINKLY